VLDDTKGYTVNIYCKKKKKIGAIDLENKMDMDYREPDHIGSDLILSKRFISNSYNSNTNLVFH
jgi:hypothetical protein